MKVRIYGEAALITGRSTIKAKVKGQDASGGYRFTHVWINREPRLGNKISPGSHQS